MVKRWKSPIDSSSYPTGGTFGELLAWHLAWGTRPDCKIDEPNQPWVKSQFAQLVHEEGLDIKSSVRSLRNWTNHGRLPDAQDSDKVRRVFEELFGDDPNLCHWKNDLEDALGQGRSNQAARIAHRDVVEPFGVSQPTAHFIGRDDDVVMLAGMLLSDDVPAVLVQGGPGIGKTELTKTVAYHPSIVEHFAARRRLVRLETSTTAKQMKNAVILAIGGTPQLGFSETIAALGGKPTLLILDNLETPWEPVGQRQETEQALADLSAVPGMTVLASFRGFDFVGGPRWKDYRVTSLAIVDAVELFASIAGEWVLDDPAIDDFIHELGGIPLAIELVARRAHGYRSLAPLLLEWKRIGVELAENDSGCENSLNSLSYSIRLSLNSERLKRYPEALRLFALLGRLPLGLRHEERDALIGERGFKAEDALLRLGLAFENNSRQDFLSIPVTRVDLLPPIRDYARRNNVMNKEDMICLIDLYRAVIKRTSLSHSIIDEVRLGAELDNIYSVFEVFDNRTYTAFINTLNSEEMMEMFGARGMNRMSMSLQYDFETFQSTFGVSPQS